MLIDTHILIWILENQRGYLGAVALTKLKTHAPIVSAASLMEIAVKKRKGKLDMPETRAIVTTLEAKNIQILDISTLHIGRLPSLETTPHADPFDLLLIAQAISEGLPLLTCDTEVLKVTYPGLRLVDGRR